MSVELAARLEDPPARARRASRSRSAASASRSPSTLDRVALLEIVVRTSVDGLEAAARSRHVRRGPAGRPHELARAGDPTADDRALRAAEAAALDAGQIAEIALGDSTRSPRRWAVGGGAAPSAPVGRPRRPPLQRASASSSRPGQPGAASIENVDLHETVQRQAVTDELTGLFNHRRFQEVMPRRSSAPSASARRWA